MRALLSLACVLALLGAARADPEAAKVHYKRGMAEFFLDHWDAAIAAFEAGFREEPQPAFLFNIAKAHARAGRPRQAIAYYDKFLQLQPDAEERPFVESEMARLAHAPATPATPAVAAVSAPPPPRDEAAARRRRGAIIGGVVGATLAVGLALGLGLGYGLTAARSDPFPHTIADLGPNKP